MPATYSHLDPGALELVTASEEARIEYVQRDRFVEHSAARAVLDLMSDFARRPISVRPPGLMLVGDAGVGKTSLIAESLRRIEESSDTGAKPRAVYCVADALPTLPVLQTSLLTAMAVPALLDSYRARWAADSLIKDALAESGARVVVFDEVQHILNLPRPQRAATWDWIKWVSTTCRVSVVCSGIPGAEEIVLRERQLQTRFSIVRLPRWSVGPAFGQFLNAFERSLPLKRPSVLGAQDFQEALLRESCVMQQIGGVTHGVKQILEHAAIRAIRCGEERITQQLLPAWRELYGHAA